jgi:hypothetical protein
MPALAQVSKDHQLVSWLDYDGRARARSLRKETLGLSSCANVIQPGSPLNGCRFDSGVLAPFSILATIDVVVYLAIHSFVAKNKSPGNQLVNRLFYVILLTLDSLFW